MFHRDTFRLIRKTRKRFTAILLIVFIGVGFMVGLMSSAPTMCASVDKYFDNYNFMDVQLYSSYGFDENDVAALESSGITEDIFPTKFTDVFVRRDDSLYVTRVQELESDINRYQLLEGRMPSAPGEALALGSSSYGTVFNIGDRLEVFLEDEDLSEKLSVLEYEIVGTVRSPQYMSDSKETSTLDNLTLSTVIFADNETFLSEYYTSLYLTVKGASEYNSFSDEYDRFIEKNLDNLQKTIDMQEPVLKEKIYREAVEEIEDGERELAEEVAKAEKEIADAKKELEDAYYQIMDAETKLQSGEKDIKSGEKKLAENEALISQSMQQLEDGKKQLADSMGLTFSEAARNIKNFYGIYNAVGPLAASPSVGDRTKISDTVNMQSAQLAVLQANIISLTDANTALETRNRQIAEQNALLAEENKLLEEQNSTLSADTPNYETIIAENNKKISGNNAIIDSNNKLSEQNTASVQQNISAIEANTAAAGQIESLITALETVKQLFGDIPLKQVPSMIDCMFSGSIKDVYDSVIAMEENTVQLEQAKAEIEKGKEKLKKSKRQLREAAAHLAEGREEYNNGLIELADAEKELAEEVAEARTDIEKAKQDLADLPEAEWTVLDRDLHYSTAMYSGNTDQMQRIGNVFPMLFFLVAALVCMTTMKRLVDEERSQIGIFSALGFSKRQIISKYVIYALSAALTGSIVSIPIGMEIFPVVIYYCWRLTYDLPDMVLTMPAEIALLGVCSFTVLMVAVTAAVAHGVLKENPSRLMRPKAPRNAKKVFIEYIPFIWKRLSFTSKVTARNIIRYKSRFFMTVVGVAGCTSLLVLGFAIKGSIAQVVSRQYEDIINYNTTVILEDEDYLPVIHSNLLADGRVNDAVPFMTYSSKVYTADEKAIDVYVMNSEDMHTAFDLRDRRTGQLLLPGEGLLVSEKFARLHNISAGDSITIESDDGIRRSTVVTGICEMYTGHYLFISDEYYSRLFGEPVNYDRIAVCAQDSRAIIKDFENYSEIQSISDFSDRISAFTTMLDTLDIIIVVITLAAGSLALVVIMNLTEVNISERIREIATLKVLGFNNKEIYSYIFKEVFILSVIGMIIGLPLGKLELVYVMGIIDMEMVMFSTVVEPSSYIFGFAITLVFTVFVMLLMRKTLRNVQMVESLKSVE